MKGTSAEVLVARGQGPGESDMQVLWAPWRMQYIEEGVSSRCIFCPAPADRPSPLNLILGMTTNSLVMLNKYPYTNGHLLVAPRHHTATLTDLPEHAFADLNNLLRRAVAIVETALRPQGINIGLNLGACAGAGVADHLHWHVVPRWTGDTNFMPVIGAVRVMPQHLLESYDRLHPFFASALNPASERPNKSAQS